MLLHLMRHAPAVPPESWDGHEIERPLTTEGQRLLRDAAQGLATLCPAFDLIASSPYRRAVETAEIVARVLRHPGKVEECPALSPGLRFDNLVRFIDQFEPAETILLVGHAPDMGRLALSLIGSPQSHGIAMGTAAVCRVDVKSLPPEDPGQLIWALPTDVLRIVGTGSDAST
jgi:phosphohistidine phosphatase